MSIQIFIILEQLGEIASLGDETIRRGYYLRLLGEIVSKVFITLAGTPAATQ